jgi:hypothetical protein
MKKVINSFYATSIIRPGAVSFNNELIVAQKDEQKWD